MARNLMWIPMAAAVMLLSSCGSHFKREWERAAEGSHPDRTIEGRWEGTWHSLATGHQGRLRCIVGPASNTTGDRPVVYWASWKHILSASFTTTHRVKDAGTVITFQGSHKMPGWAGGIYDYQGTIRKGRWQSTYRSAMDHGTFSLHRPVN